MANLDEDVIELGSSDEETEPAPKKKKPMPNVMVQIPNNLPGVTIKPTKPKINPVSLAKTNIGKAITITKVFSGSNKLSNPFARKITQNGNTVVRKQPVIAPTVVNPALKILPCVKKVQQIPVGKISKTPIKVTKAVSNPNLLRPLAPSKFIPGTSIPSTLPPGITVKRTRDLQSVLKRNNKPNPVIQKKKVNPVGCKKAPSEMVCVNLDDDDDAAPNPVGPSWYLRPEEQDKKDVESLESPKKSPELDKTSKKDACSKEEETTGKEKEATDLQKQNNKEPETPKYIEITIEDSPAKPQPKRTCEVADLAITIDDSPVKVASEKPGPASGSDEEPTTSKEKHSKKKLEYPKAVEQETVEIEIEFTPVENSDVQNKDKTDSQNDVRMEVVEIEESPLKPIESYQASTPKKKTKPKPETMKMNDLSSTPAPKPKLKLNENKPEHVSKPKPNENKPAVSTPGEFHPVFQMFIDLCFQLENSEDMNKIVENKIKPYYRTVPKDYTESEMFIDLVSNKISVMKADGAKRMYMHIKDVVDELSLQRKKAKSQPPKVVTVNEEQEKLLYGEESEFDMKRQRQIRKLEKTLKKLHRAIQKLEEQEVDFDDEEDSVYVLTESEEDNSKNEPLEKSQLLKRYKERMIRVHAKFCQLTNTKLPSEPRVHIDARPGQPKGPAKRLEKWINKKVPIGTPLPFPDFHDVLRCVKEANQEDNLCWNDVDVMEEARDLFTRCGRKLQRRRQENEWRLAAARIQSEVDPAEESVELKKALEDNRRLAYKKESAVFNKFADRQNLLNLEAVEIGDKEAEESPVESDDDEPVEENTPLQTKEKRKKGLQKLLKKKSQKGTNKQESSKTDVNSSDRTQAEKAEDTDNKENDSKDDKQNDENPISDPWSKQNSKDPLATENNESDSEKIHSLSDGSNKIGSDIDELHLLQKLHSDAFDSSTLESSDSESPIAISDSLSSGDNKKQASDVISIENSSYSESEKNDEEYEMASSSQKKVVTESVNIHSEIECSNAGVKTVKKNNHNDEFSESVEDILLASSDDERNNSENEKDPSSVDEQIIVKRAKDKNSKNRTKENSELNDVTDASSMDSIEMTVVKNKMPHESAEVTSITSTETADEDMNAVEVTSINSVEMVENDTITTLEQNPQNDVLTCVSPAATTHDTFNKSSENNEDKSMTSLKDITVTDAVTNVNSAEDVMVSEVGNKSLEETTRHTKSVEDTVTNPLKPDVNTSEVNSDTDNVNNANLANDIVMSDVQNKSLQETSHTESVEDTIIKPHKPDLDTNYRVNNDTDKVNNPNSAEDVFVSEVDNNNSEATTKPTESVENKITNTDKTDVETSKVNSGVTSTETAVIDHGPDNAPMITD